MSLLSKAEIEHMVQAAEAMKDSLVQSGWTQQDCSLALGISLGVPTRVLISIGTLRLCGDAINIHRPKGQPPTYVVATCLGVHQIPAKDIAFAPQ